MAKTLELAFVMAGKIAPSFMEAGKQATTQLKAVEKATKDIQTAAQKRDSIKSWKVFTASVKDAKSAVAGLKSEITGTLKTAAMFFAGNGLITGAVYGIAKSSASTVAALGDQAKMIGMNTQAYRELSFAAQTAGMSEQEFIGVGVKLSEEVKKALAGNEQALNNFARAGVTSFFNLDGSLKNTEQLMSEVADTFSAMENGIGKTTLAKDLLGSVKAIPMLNAGSAGINARRQESSMYDAELTDDDFVNASAFNNSFALIQRAIKGVSQTIGKELWPVLTDIHKDIALWVAEQRVWLGEQIPGWVENFKAELPALREQIRGVMQSVKDGAIWVNDMAQSMGGWSRVIKAVVAAWAAWRVLRIGVALFQVGKSVHGVVRSFSALQYAGVSVGGALRAMVSGLGKAAVGAGAFAKSAAIASFGALKFTAALGVSAAKGVAAFAASTAGATVGALKSFAAAMWPAIAAAAKFSVVLMANPIGLVIAAIAALVGTAYLVYKYWDDITAAMSAAWNWVKGIFVAGWNRLPGWLQKPLTDVYDNVVAFGGKISDAFSASWDAVTTFFSARTDAVKGAFDKGIIAGLVESVRQFNPLSIIADALNDLVRYITGFDIASAARGLIDRFSEGLLSAWASVKDGIASAVTDWIPGGGAIVDAAAAGADFLKSGANTIGSFLGFADGGIVRSPQVAMVGEAGPEVIVPVTRPRRARELMGAAASMMGLGGNVGGSPAISVTFAPSITITGDVDKDTIVPQISRTLSDKKAELEAMIRDLTYNDNRLALW